MERKEEKEDREGMDRTLASALECIRSRFPLGFAVANGASAASHVCASATAASTRMKSMSVASLVDGAKPR